MVRRRASLRGVLSSFHRIFALQQLVITAIVLSFSSCYNEPEFIGGNLIPPSDLASVKIDTSFELSAYTVKTDTIISSGFSYATLGCTNSPIFGKTKADFLTKVYLDKLRKDTALFGTSPIPDQLTLSFRMNNYYGDKSRPLLVKLYELKDTISSYKNYYGLDPIDGWYYPTEIGSTYYEGDSLLKFDVDLSIAQKILDADLDSATVASNYNFSNYFKGFYVTCEDISGNNNGVMYFFDFTSSESLKTTMTLTYHQLNDLTTRYFYFTIGSTSSTPPRFNHFQHDYTKADPLYKIKNLDEPEKQDSVFYIESMGGVHGLINLDGIEEWAKKMPIAINYAELRIEPENYLGMPVDSTLSLFYYSVDKYGYIYTQDQNIAAESGSATYSKFYNAKKYYSINLTTHIQSILAGNVTDKTLYLAPSLASSGRAVLRSGSHSKRMKMIITYSKL